MMENHFVWLTFNRNGTICSVSQSLPECTEDAWGKPWVKYEVAKSGTHHNGIV